MSSLRHLIARPGGLFLASLILGAVVWILTSSVLGFGVFVVVPFAVAWLARR